MVHAHVWSKNIHSTNGECIHCIMQVFKYYYNHPILVFDLAEQIQEMLLNKFNSLNVGFLYLLGKSIQQQKIGLFLWKSLFKKPLAIHTSHANCSPVGDFNVEGIIFCPLLWTDHFLIQVQLLPSISSTGLSLFGSASNLKWIYVVFQRWFKVFSEDLVISLQMAAFWTVIEITL